MKALVLWLLVVRLAVVGALALQCTSPRASARSKSETTWQSKSRASAESSTTSPWALPVGSTCPGPLPPSSLMLKTESATSTCASFTRTDSVRSSRFHSAPSPSQGIGTGLRASEQTSKFAERSARTQDIGACVLMRGDTSASPARACGARARDIEAIMRARARAVGRPVVRLTGDFESGAPSRPALDAEVCGSCTSSRNTLGEEGENTPRSCATGIQHSENAGTVTRPKLPYETTCATRTSRWLVRAGASRRRGFVGGRETDCTLVVEQSAHLSAARARDRGNTERRVGDLAPSVMLIAQVGLIAFEQRCPACTLRGGAAVARQAHNLEAGGSIPSLASRSGCHEKSTRFVAGNGDEDCSDLSESANAQKRKPVGLAHSTRGSDLYSLDAPETRRAEA